MNAFFGRQFEAFVRDEYAGTVLFGVSGQGTGGIKKREIDLVAVDDSLSSIVFGECKWGDISVPEAKKIITRLKTKAKLVHADKYRHRKYALFSAGIIEGKERLLKERVLIFDSKNIEGSLPEKRNRFHYQITLTLICPFGDTGSSTSGLFTREDTGYTSISPGG